MPLKKIKKIKKFRQLKRSLEISMFIRSINYESKSYYRKLPVKFKVRKKKLKIHLKKAASPPLQIHYQTGTMVYLTYALLPFFCRFYIQIGICLCKTFLTLNKTPQNFWNKISHALFEVYRLSGHLYGCFKLNGYHTTSNRISGDCFSSTILFCDLLWNKTLRTIRFPTNLK